MPEYSMSRFYTEREVAQILNCSAKTVTKNRRKGLIAFVAVTERCIRIRGQQICDFIEGRTRLAAASAQPQVQQKKEPETRSGRMAPQSVDGASESFFRAYMSCIDLDDVDVPKLSRRTSQDS